MPERRQVRDFQCHVQITDRCAPWKFAIDAEDLVLQALQFHWMGVCRKLPGAYDRSSE
jgi:hypothetical protein